MVAQTSTVPAVLDTLKALLEARRDSDPDSDLAGVTILTAPSGEPNFFESIQFYGTEEDSHRWADIGSRRRTEEYTLTGDIAIVRPGAGEAEAVAARDRAYAILAAMQQVVWDNHTTWQATRTDIEFTSGSLEQGWQDNGRVVFIRFGIAVKSTLTR